MCYHRKAMYVDCGHLYEDNGGWLLVTCSKRRARGRCRGIFTDTYTMKLISGACPECSGYYYR
jgi:predicted  nucleic acid-binding Zn-ribbon protein